MNPDNIIQYFSMDGVNFVSSHSHLRLELMIIGIGVYFAMLIMFAAMLERGAQKQ